jgi:hypothetical protein
LSEDDICGYGKQALRNGWSEDESGLCQHAKRELQLAGLFDQDSDYEGMTGTAVYEIIKAFAQQGHSGSSAEITTDIVLRLMRYQPLTPITSNPDDWIDQSAISGIPMWQCRRNPALFSTDGGENWFSVGDGGER